LTGWRSSCGDWDDLKIQSERNRGFEVIFHAPKDILKLVPEKGIVNLKELGLNERQIGALSFMINEGLKFSNKEYRRLFDVSNQTFVRDMRLLKKLNLVTTEGKGRSLRYKAE